MAEVVIIGPAALNQIVRLDALPEQRPHTLTARSHHLALGGTSAGKTLHLAWLGRSTLCVTMVGDDADAAAITRALAADRVEVLALTAPGPSEHHLNLMTERGERLSIYLDHAPARAVTPAERRRVHAELAQAKAVALDLSRVGLLLIDEVANSGAPVWVDVHDYDGRTEFHAPFVAAADVLLMNADGMADPVPFLRAQVKRGARTAVCTLGPDGAVGVAGDGTVVTVAAEPAVIVDTNGAGDAFMAGMMHASLGWSDSSAWSAEHLAEAMTAGAKQAVRALASSGVGPA